MAKPLALAKKQRMFRIRPIELIAAQGVTSGDYLATMHTVQGPREVDLTSTLAPTQAGRRPPLASPTGSRRSLMANAVAMPSQCPRNALAYAGSLSLRRQVWQRTRESRVQPTRIDIAQRVAWATARASAKSKGRCLTSKLSRWARKGARSADTSQSARTRGWAWSASILDQRIGRLAVGGRSPPPLTQ